MEIEDMQNTNENSKTQNKANLDLKMVSFLDVSEEVVTNASQDIEKNYHFPKSLNQEELDTCKLLKKGLSKKTERKGYVIV